jgi:hypothetical protein
LTYCNKKKKKAVNLLKTLKTRAKCLIYFLWWLGRLKNIIIAKILVKDLAKVESVPLFLENQPISQELFMDD